MHKIVGFIKRIAKKFIKKDTLLYKVFRKIYHVLSTAKYKITNHRKIKAQRKYYNEQATKSVSSINQYKEAEYIVFYNPTWLGVANSTKGLFKNIVPLEHVYKKKIINNIASEIAKNDIKSVIFSQVCDGWIDILKQIKKINENIKIKIIWHGNCYEFFSDFTWNLNKEVMQLYKKNKIDSFAFVRTTMYEFYKKAGFKCFYLQNNVHLEKIEKIKEKSKDKKKKIGIYNADSRELKNIYTSLSAIKLLEDGVADVVPINDGAKKFAKILKLKVTSVNDYIPTEELLKRIQQNEVNIYPTFTENAPMFPLESFEMEVPCLLGNNNDYFTNTKLGEYIILTKEDDPEYIKDKIVECIKNKNEIIKLYKEWKKEFDVKCENLVKEFIKN